MTAEIASEATDQAQDHPIENSPRFVVGIGASAGGLEALEELFRSMPSSTGMAFIVVQHLSPDFKSLMDDLLRRVTNIPIRMIDNEMPIEADNIYLLRPNQELICSGGKLLMTDRSAGRELSFPIDQFFRSLANDMRDRAIAIILSGTGTDGSRGICEVHEGGGLVIAQSVDSAKFDGMPRAARDTGITDAILTPSEMPEALRTYSENPNRDMAAFGKDALILMDGPMFTVFHLLKKHCGIDFSDYKTTTISRRIQRRVMLSGMSDLESYVEVLKGNDAEIDRLYKDLLIGVTTFFRDTDVFERLEVEVIPSLMDRLSEEEEFRAWIVGTATGEEAYSLAILIAEFLEQNKCYRPVKIFATDVHRDSLDAAGRGIYSEESLVGLSSQRLEKFFVHKSDGYHVTPELRKMVVFVPHNVIRDAPFTKLDLVTCRNVLIYLTPPVQRKVLSLFHFALKRDAVLCLGPSESTGDLANDFSTIDNRHKIFRKHRDIPLAAGTRMPISSPSMPALATDTPALARFVGARDLMATYDQILDEVMPPSILINANREFLHSFGGASIYLQHRDGRASSDILDIIHPDVRTALSSAIRRVDRDAKPVAFGGVSVRLSDEMPELKLTVHPLTQRRGSEDHRLIVFESQQSLPLPPDELFDAHKLSDEEVNALERELQHTRDNLQATIEQLQTTNEELQSANEQLIASNEELQSTNEELHSVNEELYTVNAEHQRKIDELTELTDDMDNLLGSTNVHTVFLDSELRIRRFTPGIADTFNLIPQDVGRCIDSFTHNIQDKDLLFEVKQVLETESPYEREVRDRSGSWFLMRILPYLAGRRVDGVVLTLVEITSRKQAERKLAEVSEIVEQSNDAIMRMANDGTVTTWNRGAQQLFGFPEKEIVGRNVQVIVPEALQQQAKDCLDKVVEGETVEHQETLRLCRDGREIDVALTISPIRDESGDVVGVSEIIRDITDRKRLEVRLRDEIQRRDRFLAMLSHELRNPLGAMLSATYLLDSETPANKREEAYQVVQRQAEHMAGLLNDLMDVSRVSQGKIRLTKQPLDLTKLVPAAVETVRPLLDAREQRLVVEVPEDPVWIHASAQRIHQIQVNLLSNASRYSPAGESVMISVSREMDNAIIRVQDNGIGIREELLERIFDLFVQGDRALDRSEGGMGVGLTLVRWLVELHHGTITANSKGPGRGSQFEVELPAIPAPEKGEGEEISAVEPIPDGRRILLIEDNRDAREMFESMLSLKGFDVVTAADGRTGLELARRDRPNMAIIDIGLPEMDGYEVASQIREDPALTGMHLVALTGYGQDSDRQRAFDAGFDDHLTKPLQPEGLFRLLSNAKFREVTAQVSPVDA